MRRLGIAVVLIIVLLGVVAVAAMDPSTGKNLAAGREPTATATRVPADVAVENYLTTYLAANFGPVAGATSWYADMKAVRVDGNDVTVTTSLAGIPAERAKADGICMAISSFGAPDGRHIENVDIVAGNGVRVMQRIGVAGKCDWRFGD